MAAAGEALQGVLLQGEGWGNLVAFLPLFLLILVSSLFRSWAARKRRAEGPPPGREKRIEAGRTVEESQPAVKPQPAAVFPPAPPPLPQSTLRQAPIPLSGEKEPAPSLYGFRNPALRRISSLPLLEQGILWKEILGPPRGF
jgi:hypothetical protein